jgi:hypothetical protein
VIQGFGDSHVLRSNRSACFSQLGRHLEALADAEEAIKLAPAWPKGYSRKAAAHFFLSNFDEAHAAYSKALALAPNDELIARALADVTAEQARLLRRARLQRIIATVKTQKPCPQVYLNDHGLADEDVLQLCSALRGNEDVQSLWMGDNMIGVSLCSFCPSHSTSLIADHCCCLPGALLSLLLPPGPLTITDPLSTHTLTNTHCQETWGQQQSQTCLPTTRKADSQTNREREGGRERERERERPSLREGTSPIPAREREREREERT